MFRKISLASDLAFSEERSASEIFTKKGSEKLVKILFRGDIFLCY